MSHISFYHSLVSRKTVSLAALALVAGLSLQPSSVQAAQAHVRQFQANSYDDQFWGGSHALWRKPNGAEILGGFYGPDDEVNVQTGEVRHR